MTFDTIRGLVGAHPWAAVLVAYVAGQLTAVWVLWIIPRDPDKAPRPRATLERRRAPWRATDDDPPGAA